MARKATEILFIAGVLGAGTACQQEYSIGDGPVDVDPGDVTDCPFSPIGGTKMSIYDCNPVFSSSDEDWGTNVGSVGFHVTDVLGHPFYQMWYTASPANAEFGQFGMGYAVSGNGTDWDVHEGNPLFQADPNAWDSDSVAGQVVVWDPDFGQYVMAYQGFTLGASQFDPGIWGLGIATSPDGVNWSKHPNNPVLDFTEMQTTGPVSPCWPVTINKASGGFRGFIAASEFDPFGGLFGGTQKCELYPMTSIDLSTWTIGSSPILLADQPYDASGIASAAVVEFAPIDEETGEEGDSTLYMFYVGFEDWIEGSGFVSATRLTLNLATSFDDGLTWNKDPNNPLPINLTNPGEVSNVSAQVVGNRIHIWVTDTYPDMSTSAVGYYLYEPTIEAH